MNIGRYQVLYWGRWPTFRRYQFPTEGPHRGMVYDLCLYFGLFELRRFSK